MIEDIEGATSEPARGRHVVVLSGAVAIASLVLLLTLVVPAPVGTLPQAASTAPSARAGPLTTFVSNSASQLRVDLTLVSWCADGTRLTPPFYLVFEAGTGRVSAIGFDGRTGDSVPVAFVRDSRTSPLTVRCVTSGNVVPWDGIAR